MSLLDDLRELMLEINGGPGTGRKPMRLGDGSGLSRLEAALAQLPHLEEGARLLAITEDHPEWAGSFSPFVEKYWDDLHAWRAAEAKRKEQTNG